jgi:uncharacterized protein
MWYFRRSFCPSCGATEPAERTSGGRGIVCASTTVTRPPKVEFASHVPYVILLVDMEEGFRMMSHGDPALRIGDHAVAGFREFGGAQLPYFVAAPVRGIPRDLE